MNLGEQSPDKSSANQRAAVMFDLYEQYQRARTGGSTSDSGGRQNGARSRRSGARLERSGRERKRREDEKEQENDKPLKPSASASLILELHQKLFLESQRLEKVVSRRRPGKEETAAALRKLRSIYVMLVLKFPQYSLRKHIARKLWQFHYKQFERFLKQISRENKSEPDSSAKSARAKLIECLDPACAFYTDLTARIQLLVEKETDEVGDANLDIGDANTNGSDANTNAGDSNDDQILNGGTNGESNSVLIGMDSGLLKDVSGGDSAGISGTSNNIPDKDILADDGSSTSSGSLSRIEPNLSPLNALLCACFCALGDIERYRQKARARSGAEDWDMAIRCYTKALEAAPGTGKVHNQLAVIAGSVDDLFSALYHFVRSMAGSRPFVSRENLLQLFERNRKQLEKIRQQKISLPNLSVSAYKRNIALRPPPKQANISLKKRFLTRFIALQGMIYEHVGLDHFDHILSELSLDAERLFPQNTGGSGRNRNSQSGGLSDGELLHLSAISVFVIRWAAAKVVGQPVNTLSTRAAAVAAEVFGWVMGAACVKGVRPKRYLSHLAPLSVLFALVCDLPALFRADDDGNERARWFATRLAELANGAAEVPFESLSSIQDTCNIEELSGFMPLVECERWNESPVHDLAWQLATLSHAASTILPQDDITG
eukprot:890302_1